MPAMKPPIIIPRPQVATVEQVDVTTFADSQKVTIAVMNLTPERIDGAIAEYETSLLDLETLQKRAAELKKDLIALVEQAGTVPANASKSKRVQGLTRSATLTWSTSNSVNEEGVGRLQAFLESKGLVFLFASFFALQTPPVYVPPPPKHRAVNSPGVVFEKLGDGLGARVRNKILELYAGAIDSRTNAPSLKVGPAK